MKMFGKQMYTEIQGIFFTEILNTNTLVEIKAVTINVT